MRLKTFFSRIAVFLVIAPPFLKGAEVLAAEDAFLSPQASIGVKLEPAKLLFVKDTVANSPSAKAGLQHGDILLSLNKGKVQSSTDLLTTMSTVQPGQLVDVEIARFDSEQQAYKFHEVIVEATASPTPDTANRASLGILLDEADLLAVKEAIPDSPSTKAGMQQGDILLALNKYAISNGTQLRTALLMVKLGQTVDVEFLHYNAEQQPPELRKANVETVAKTALFTSTPPETLTLADLAGHPDRWPATVTLKKDVTLPDGKTVSAGEEFRVTAFDEAGGDLTLEDNIRSLSIAPQDLDFLQAANVAWSALTPLQREIDLAKLLSDSSLWPVQVASRRLLKSTTGVNVNAGENLDLVEVRSNGTLWLHSPKTNTVMATIADTDVLVQARERALLEPQERPSRIASALRPYLVDANGQPYTDAKLDDSRIFVFYYGANWCGPCHRFSPKLAQYVKGVTPNNPRLSVTFLNLDQDPNQMLAYMQQDQMPWPAVPMASANKSAILSRYSGDKSFGVPRLVVVDRHGNLIVDSNGRGLDDTLQVLNRLLDAGAAQ